MFILQVIWRSWVIFFGLALFIGVLLDTGLSDAGAWVVIVLSIVLGWKWASFRSGLKIKDADRNSIPPREIAQTIQDSAPSVLKLAKQAAALRSEHPKDWRLGEQVASRYYGLLLDAEQAGQLAAYGLTRLPHREEEVRSYLTERVNEVVAGEFASSYSGRPPEAFQAFLIAFGIKLGDYLVDTR